MKYYKNAKLSLKAQSETPYERFMALKNNAEKRGNTYNDTAFLKEKNINKKDMNKSMYLEQNKLIPTEQLLNAKELIDKKLAKARLLGNKNKIQNLEEIKQTLTDVLKDEKGNKSIPLSRENAQKLTEAAKKGKIDDELLKECGLDVNNLISGTDILKQSLKAGLSAAILTTIITMAPTILNGIGMLISNGKIDKDLFKEAGYDALDPAAKSFLTGTITSILVAACKTGKLGPSLVDINPSFISTSVVLVIGILDNSIKFANGKINKEQMADEIARMFTITAFSTGTGILSSIWFAEVPPLAALAYTLGSFLGSIIGSIAYNIGNNIFMSFCIESGFIFFGIVEQNYELPKEIIEEIGIQVFDYDKFDYNEFKYDKFEIRNFNQGQFEYDKFVITILRKGVLEIGKIGYI